MIGHAHVVVAHFFERLHIPVHIHNPFIGPYLLKLVALADDVAENWELFWITQGQERFSQAQSRRFTVSTNGDGKCYLVVKLPAEATMLRVDPPPRSALRIYDIELVVNHKKKLVQISDLDRKSVV